MCESTKSCVNLLMKFYNKKKHWVLYIIDSIKVLKILAKERQDELKIYEKLTEMSNNIERDIK